MSGNWSEFVNECKIAGLTPRDCGGGHWQVKGGKHLINYYPATGCMYRDGKSSVRGCSIVDAVLEAGKAEPRKTVASTSTMEPVDRAIMDTFAAAVLPECYADACDQAKANGGLDIRTVRWAASVNAYEMALEMMVRRAKIHGTTFTTPTIKDHERSNPHNAARQVPAPDANGTTPEDALDNLSAWREPVVIREGDASQG